MGENSASVKEASSTEAKIWAIAVFAIALGFLALILT